MYQMLSVLVLYSIGYDRCFVVIGQGYTFRIIYILDKMMMRVWSFLRKRRWNIQRRGQETMSP